MPPEAANVRFDEIWIGGPRGDAKRPDRIPRPRGAADMWILTGETRIL